MYVGDGDQRVKVGERVGGGGEWQGLIPDVAPVATYIRVSEAYVRQGMRRNGEREQARKWGLEMINLLHKYGQCGSLGCARECVCLCVLRK